MHRKEIKNIIVCFGIMIIVFYALLILTYLISDEMIMEKWVESVNIINSEEKRWMVLPGNEATRLDTFTDNLIFQKMTNTEFRNPFSSSLWLDGYYRYWMGVHIFLRPALLFINYSGIRYFNMIILITLFSVTIIKMKSLLEWRFLIAFIGSLSMIHFWIFPLSIQYSAVFYVMLISILLVIHNHKAGKLSLASDVILFIIIGALTNYFDLLTAPLLTFGISFIVLFALRNSSQIDSSFNNFKLLVSTGISWLIGYSFTWISKWIIGSVILRENMISVAIKQILFRTGGDIEDFSRITMLRNLTNLMFPSYMVKLFAVILVVWFTVFIFYRNPFKKILSLTPLLIISIVPYLWFLILSNHNYHHAYFTYRIQAVTVFSLMTFMILAVDWDRVKKKVSKIRLIKD